MKAGRYSFDSQINFGTQSSTRKSVQSARLYEAAKLRQRYSTGNVSSQQHQPSHKYSKRSLSLNNERKNSTLNSSRNRSSVFSYSSLPYTASRKRSQNLIKLSNNSTKSRYSITNPSESFDNSSINSLFVLNRVKSFTWKLKRHLIQSSIDSECLPPQVLYPGASNKTPLTQSHSVKLHHRPRTQIQPRHFSMELTSMKQHTHNSNNQDIVCSTDDFCQIIGHHHSKTGRAKLTKKSSSLSQCNSLHKCSSVGSLLNDHSETVSGNHPTNLSTNESIRLDEIKESTDKENSSGNNDEVEEEEPDMASLLDNYNFTYPNIQILGDAIQQHLQLMMSIQFGEKTSTKSKGFDTDLFNDLPMMVNKKHCSMKPFKGATEENGSWRHFVGFICCRRN